MLVKDMISGYGNRAKLSSESGVPKDTLSKWAVKGVTCNKVDGEWFFYTPKRLIWPRVRNEHKHS